MLPGMKSAGVFKDAEVTCVELLDSMGCIVAGYSNGKLPILFFEALFIQIYFLILVYRMPNYLIFT